MKNQYVTTVLAQYDVVFMYIYCYVRTECSGDTLYCTSLIF